MGNSHRKWCPSARGVLTCFRARLMYTVIDSMLCIRMLRVQITSWSPNVKAFKHCVTGEACTRDLQITRKASWPLAQRGALFLVDPEMVFAVTLAYFLSLKDIKKFDLPYNLHKLWVWKLSWSRSQNRSQAKVMAPASAKYPGSGRLRL